MLRLSTFGGLSLGNGRPFVSGAGAQRSRLALLAAIAAAGERGISRDRLMAIFWPEADQERARGALKQAIYSLRRDLLDQEVIVGTTDLRLDSAVISSDIQDFREAVSSGDWLRATELYTGPFLDGVYLRNNPEFERWAGDERARLQATYVNAVRSLAEGAATRGDWAQSTGWWSILCRLDALNREFAEATISAALRAGDVGAAQSCFRAHEAALAADLGSNPHPSTVQLMESARTGASRGPVSRDSPASLAASARDAVEDVPTVLAERRRRRPRSAAIILSAFALLASAVLASFAWRKPPAPGAADRIAVLPFRVTSPDPSLQRLGVGIVDLLSPLFSGEIGSPPSVSPTSVLREWRASTRDFSADEAVAIGKTIGATEVVTGTIVTLGRVVRINADVYRVRDGSIAARVTFAGPVDSLPDVIEKLAARLLAARAGESPERLDYVTPSSPFALNEYLAGRVALRAGRFEDARLYFSRALDSDTTFALAALGLTEAGAWALWSGAERERKIVTRTLALRAHLSARDRALFDALVGTPGKVRTAAREIADWERAVTRLPDVASAWYEYGDRLFHVGAFVGIEDAWQRAAAAFNKTVALDPDFAPPYAHLVQTSIVAGDLAIAKLNMNKVESAGIALKELEFIRWRYTLAASTSARPTDYTQLSGQALERIVGTTQLDGLPLEHADRAIRELRRRDATADQQLVVHLADFSLALNRGDHGRALSVLDDMEALEPIPAGRSTSFFSVDQLRVLSALFGGVPAGFARRSALSVSARAMQSRAPGARARAVQVGDLCTAGLWHAEAGDTTTAARMLRRLTDEEGFADSLLFFAADPRLCARLLDAAVAVAGRKDDAISRVRLADSTMKRGPSAFGGDFGNVLLARLYLRLSDPRAALRCIRRRSYYWTSPGTLYLAQKVRLERDLARTSGDRVGEARADRHLAALRSTHARRP